jgi:uncharacterized membrane protein
MTSDFFMGASHGLPVNPALYHVQQPSLWWLSNRMSVMTDQKIYFAACLTPNRSLSPIGFVWLMASLVGISFCAGMAFVLAGAWPVVGFFGLDVLAVYIAFRFSYRSGRLVEELRLSSEALEVTRIEPKGKITKWRLPSWWLQVHIEEPAEHSSQLEVRTHGRSLVIGAFLAPEERSEVATGLRDGLRKMRAGNSQ